MIQKYIFRSVHKDENMPFPSERASGFVCIAEFMATVATRQAAQTDAAVDFLSRDCVRVPSTLVLVAPSRF
eukprot:SAG31_NODE_1069_length_10077_cov_2.403588_3_plen_71_part_00